MTVRIIEIFPQLARNAGRQLYIHDFRVNPDRHEMMRLEFKGTEQDSISRGVEWAIEKSRNGTDWVTVVSTVIQTGARSYKARSLSTNIEGLEGLRLRVAITTSGGRLNFGARLILGKFSEVNRVR